MRDGSVEFEWAGSARLFRLGWGELIALQEHCDAGPYHILARIGAGGWRVRDLLHTIRLGLIGGGCSAPEARALVTEHVEGNPPTQNVLAAQIILAAALVGADDEAPGKERKSSDRPPAELRNGKIKIAGLFGAGAAMGFTPDDVKRCAVWEFSAALSGYVDANTPPDKGLADDERDDLWEMVQARMAMN